MLRGARAAALRHGALVAVLALGCAGFDTSPGPEPGPAQSLVRLLVSEAFSRPQNLRPCCAFGYALGVEVAEVPVPVFEVQNVIAPDDLGRHTYDGGMISMRNSAQRAFLSSENNGLVFTCRGGFLDLAHVRDYADWTAFDKALGRRALVYRIHQGAVPTAGG